MKNSFIILLFFIAGIVAGRYMPELMGMIEKWDLYLLMALMFLVGISIGKDQTIITTIKKLDKRLLILPLCTIFGTLLGAFLIAFLLKWETTDVMAISSGFAYYSLSSIFITQLKGAELGTIALLANIAREMITLLLAPLLVMLFGKLAPISAGGATTMDTTLPIIVQTSGKEITILAIYHGFVVDLSVPFLVTFFCSI